MGFVRPYFCCLALLLSLLPAAASGLAIGVVSDPVVGVSDLITVEISVSGAAELGNFASPSVREFDFDLTFDDTLVSFVGVDFAGFLGTPPVTALVTSSAALSVVDAKEVSLLSEINLDALQPDAFLLLTVTFQALQPGLADFTLTQRDIGDAAGTPFTVTGPSEDTTTIVPEPAVALLVLGGLIALAARARAGA